MQTYKEIAQVIKQAADKLAELQACVESKQKESDVSSLVSSMKEKGLLNDKTAGEKTRELLNGNASDLQVHKKALDLIGGRPTDTASLTKRSAQSTPESSFDSWVFGG